MLYFLICNLLQINYPVNPVGFVFYSIGSLFVRVGILVYPLRLDAAEYKVNFKRAFFLSFVVGLIAFTLESAFDTFFVTMVDPDFLDNYVKSAEELYKSTEMEPKAIDANVKLIKEFAAGRRDFFSHIFGIARQSAFMAFLVALAFVRGNRLKTEG